MGVTSEELAAKLTTHSVIGGSIVLGPDEVRAWARTLDKISEIEVRRQQMTIKAIDAMHRRARWNIWDQAIARVFVCSWIVVMLLEITVILAGWA